MTFIINKHTHIWYHSLLVWNEMKKIDKTVRFKFPKFFEAVRVHSNLNTTHLCDAFATSPAIDNSLRMTMTDELKEMCSKLKMPLSV